MTLEYKVTEKDFVDYQLFAASQSERINKKKKNEWVILTVGLMAAAIYFLLQDNTVLAIYCGILTIACALFFPKYFVWRYKKHYQTFAKENYSKRFGESEYLEIREDSIYTRDKTGEGKINLSEVEKVDETASHFFLKISTGVSLIIPKRELQNCSELKAKFTSLGINVNDLEDWKWN